MLRNRRISDENPMTVSKSILMADRECDGALGKTCGTKRALPECAPSPSRSNAHIVYVRRKPETDLAKRKVCDAQIDRPRVMETTTTDQSEAARKLDKSLICASDVAPLSSPGSAVCPSLGTSAHTSTPAENVEQGRLNSSSPVPEDPTTVDVTLWEERYCRLQNFLKVLDQSDQHDYVQMLRSLSSVELSGHAVELEKRSINLSMEEAKEIQRVGLFDVLGKCGKKVCKASSQQEQLQLQK